MILGCDHDEAFFTWRPWLEDGSLVAPFAVVHVDAHADMGLGDAGYVSLMSELLASPVNHASQSQTWPFRDECWELPYVRRSEPVLQVIGICLSDPPSMGVKLDQ